MLFLVVRREGRRNGEREEGLVVPFLARSRVYGKPVHEGPTRADFAEVYLDVGRLRPLCKYLRETTGLVLPTTPLVLRSLSRFKDLRRVLLLKHVTTVRLRAVFRGVDDSAPP